MTLSSSYYIELVQFHGIMCASAQAGVREGPVRFETGPIHPSIHPPVCVAVMYYSGASEGKQEDEDRLLCSRDVVLCGY